MVLFEVDECGRGTSRFDRQKSALDNVASVLSSIVPSIQSQSIKYYLRFGKFNSSSSRPRPIVVKFIRSVDVTNILANRWSLSPPYSLKPDLSPTERLKESIFLKERWKLIQSGTLRKDIKIKNDRLFVHGNVFGKLVDCVFYPSDIDVTSSLASPVVASHPMSPSTGAKSENSATALCACPPNPNHSN